MVGWNPFNCKAATDQILKKEADYELEDHQALISTLQSAFRRSEEARLALVGQLQVQRKATERLAAATLKAAALEESLSALQAQLKTSEAERLRASSQADDLHLVAQEALGWNHEDLEAAREHVRRNRDITPAGPANAAAPPATFEEFVSLPGLRLRLTHWIEGNQAVSEQLGLFEEDEVMLTSYSAFAERCLKLLEGCGEAIARLTKERDELEVEADNSLTNYAKFVAQEEGKAQAASPSGCSTATPGTPTTIFTGSSSSGTPSEQETTQDTADVGDLQPRRLDFGEEEVSPAILPSTKAASSLARSSGKLRCHQRIWQRRRKARAAQVSLQRRCRRRLQSSLQEVEQEQLALSCERKVLQRLAEEDQQNARILEQLREEITTILTCPITQQLIEGPSLAPDGRTYEYEAIHSWAAKHQTCPFTRNPLPPALLRPNRVAQALLLLRQQFWPSDPSAAALLPAKTPPFLQLEELLSAIRKSERTTALECLARMPHLEGRAWSPGTVGWSFHGANVHLLHMAVCLGLDDVAVALVQRADYPLFGESNGVLAIHVAAWVGALEVCQAIVERAPSLPEVPTSSPAVLLEGTGRKIIVRGQLPHALARSRGHTELAAFLEGRVRTVDNRPLVVAPRGWRRFAPSPAPLPNSLIPSEGKLRSTELSRLRATPSTLGMPSSAHHLVPLASELEVAGVEQTAGHGSAVAT